MLVMAPVRVLRGFLDRMAKDCDLSALPLTCAVPFNAPFDVEVAFLGFLARPLAWAAIVRRRMLACLCRWIAVTCRRSVLPGGCQRVISDCGTNKELGLH